MKFSVLDRSRGVARACPFSITRVVDCRGVGPMARRGPRRGAAIGVPRRARFGARPPRPARSPVSAGWVAGDRDPGDRGGMGSYAGFATWAATAPIEVLAQLGIRFRRPTEKTFRAVFQRLDPADLDRRLGAYFTALAATEAAAEGSLLAVVLDGKTLRGARRAAAAAAHLVSVFAHRARLAKLERAKPDFRVKSGCCGWSAVGVRRPNVLCRQGYRGHCGRCGMPRAVVAR